MYHCAQSTTVHNAPLCTMRHWVQCITVYNVLLCIMYHCVQCITVYNVPLCTTYHWCNVPLYTTHYAVQCAAVYMHTMHTRYRYWTSRYKLHNSRAVRPRGWSPYTNITNYVIRIFDLILLLVIEQLVCHNTLQSPASHKFLQLYCQIVTCMTRN